MGLESLQSEDIEIYIGSAGKRKRNTPEVLTLTNSDSQTSNRQEIKLIDTVIEQRSLDRKSL